MIIRPIAGNLLVEPLPDCAAWTAFFHDAEIPVMRETAEALEAFRCHEDATDANNIGEMISGDPLMTLKVLAHEATHRGSRVITAAETVTAAIVMMGVTPFFRAFGPQPTVEDRMMGNEPALVGLQCVLQRANRGADLALAFAIHRADPHAALIHAAALLHEFTEMLLWCHAPELAIQVAKLQEADAVLRSTVAQRQVLNIDLTELQAGLVGAWQLPALLSEARTDVPATSKAAARTVSLATRLARHTVNGWDNAAIPDDLHEISLLLNLSSDATRHFVQHV